MKWTATWLLVMVLLLPQAEGARRRTRRHTSSDDTDAMLRVLSTEDRRTLKDHYLHAALHHPSRRVVKAALLALGRIGDASALDEISKFFTRRDNDYKKTAAFALSLMADDTALKILVQNIPMQRDPEVLAALYPAVGRVGSERNVTLMANAIKDSNDARILRAACEGLGALWSSASEKWEVPANIMPRLFKLAQGIQGQDVAIACAFALARYKGDASQIATVDALETLGKAPAQPVKPLLLRVMSRLRTTPITTELLQQAENADELSVRIEAIKALSTHALSDSVQETLRKLLNDPSSVVVVQTLEAIAYHGSAGSVLSSPVDSIVQKTTASPWVRGIALKALMAINPARAHDRVGEVLEEANSPIQLWAVSALAIAPTDADLVKLAEFIDHENFRIAEEAIDGLSSLTEDKFNPAIRAALKRALERGDSALSSLVAQLVEKFKWKDFAPSLATVYPLFLQPDQIEAKTAILAALASVGDHSHVPLLEGAIKDSEHSVATAAADAIRAITGRDESGKIPPNSRSTPMAFSTKDIQTATHARVLLKTTRGDIEMRLLEATPLTDINFVRLVKKNFYEGKTFHRIVPNFVVQGGDPRGDGYGSPGYLIRDELSPTPHLRGTVGMATAGRDTGGCQFFINTGANLHLDGKYTVFAEVTKGMDVVEKIEVGDKIVSASVL